MAGMARRVSIFYHPDCLLHDTGPHHPECAARLTAAKQALEAAPFSADLDWHEPTPAEAKWIDVVHSAEYRSFIEESCLSGRHIVDTGDTVICEDSYRAALLAAGAAINAVDAVMKDNYNAAFCLTRPPGHHACAEKAMGFCLFNNIAIATHYAQAVHGIERICILDWDVHHGNGTQDIFYNSPSVLFCSIHELPLFPHTGEHFETGSKGGSGTTLNCPVPAYADFTAYRKHFENEISPKIEAFAPQLMLLSAGFDAHKRDPLANIQLGSEDFYTLTQWGLALAEKHAQGRLVSLLEGGYDFKGLAEGVTEHVRALLDGER